MARSETYAKNFPGETLPVWWPKHPGTGCAVTHLLRTICNLHGAGMKAPPTDTCGFYEELADGVSPSCNHPGVKRAVMLHVSKVSEGTETDKSQRPFVSCSISAMSQVMFASAKETFEKIRAMSQQLCG